ncbi:alginate export family protein [candidate division KSB1 bacterium]|nr:alginate export family protein [candidate division KSB1 bacterium]
MTVFAEMIKLPSFKQLLFIVFSTIAAPAVALAGTENTPPRHHLILGSAEISLNGSYRLRAETQDAYNIKSYGTARTENFLLSRLRLDADVKIAENARLRFQVQDARIVGHTLTDDDFGDNNPFHDPLDINQAYFDWQPISSLGLTLGRQSISFRDRRVFGPGDWGNTGRYAWNAARLTLMHHGIESNWIIGRFILHDPGQWPNRRAAGPTAYACYTTINYWPVDLDLFYVLKKDDRRTQGETDIGDLASHSMGFWLNKSLGAWDIGATWAGQLGRRAADDIRAMGAVVSLGRTFQVSGKPYVQLQYVTGSGDEDPNDGVHNTFDGIFSGADTDLYGWMNLFFWKNLREYRINMSLHPTRAFNLRSEYHYFMLDAAQDSWYFPGQVQRQDKSGHSGRELGHEMDMIVQYKAGKSLDLRGGVCVFFPGDFVRNTGESPICRWYFLETIVTI